jgi:hypothetical protein
LFLDSRGDFVRAGFEDSRKLLKGMTDACFRLGGGASSFAMLVRVGVSQLVKYANCGNPEFADYVIPIDIAVAADMRAGNPIIIAEAARQLGYRLVADEAPIAARRVDSHFATEMMAESTEAWRAIVDALAGDNFIDSLEKKKILKELYEARRIIDQGIAGLERGEGE